MLFFLFGIGLLTTIIGLFWLKDQLESPLLFRIVHSGLIARLAVVGAAFIAMGLLLMVADFVEGWSA